MAATVDRIVLASRSRIRAAMLRDAGLAVTLQPVRVDETALMAGWRREGADAATIALGLARAKAEAAAPSLGARDLIVGADQVLWADGAPHEAAETAEVALERLAAWSGRPHVLVSAVVARIGHRERLAVTESVTVHMAAYSRKDLETYRAQAAAALTETVGGYEIEGLGAQLIDRIEGDYFSALGMPLWPLLRLCRELGLVPA